MATERRRRRKARLAPTFPGKLVQKRGRRERERERETESEKGKKSLLREAIVLLLASKEGAGT